MKRKTSVLLAMMLTTCMAATSCNVFLQDAAKPGNSSSSSSSVESEEKKPYKTKEFLNVDNFGERARMPGEYFTWTYAGVLLDRMNDASEITVREETYADYRGVIEGGKITRRVIELKIVLYNDYVAESVYSVDGKVQEIQKLSLEVREGEKKLVQEWRYGSGMLKRQDISDWYENGGLYYSFLIDQTDHLSLGTNYYDLLTYKKGDIYSSYGVQKTSYDYSNQGSTLIFNKETECLIQFTINDSVDRFDKKYVHSISYLEKDNEGNLIGPCSESFKEFTAVYGPRKTYNK